MSNSQDQYLLQNNSNDDLSLELKQLTEKWKQLVREPIVNKKKDGCFTLIKFNSTNKKKILGYGSINNNTILVVSDNSENLDNKIHSIHKFGNKKLQNNFNGKLNMINVENIECILFFIDSNTYRFNNQMNEIINILRSGFKEYSSKFWKKIIIVFYNTKEIGSDKFKIIYNPTNDKDNYDMEYIDKLYNLQKKKKDFIKDRITCLKKEVINFLKKGYDLNEESNLEFIIMDDLYVRMEIPYGINFVDKKIKPERIKMDIRDGYSELYNSIKSKSDGFTLKCQIVDCEGLPTHIYKGKYLIGTKLKRSYKLITVWFVTILCLNILIGFSTNNFNNRLYLTIPVCGVFDMIAFYYRKQIVQIIYPCLYKYIKNDTTCQYGFNL